MKSKLAIGTALVSTVLIESSTVACEKVFGAAELPRHLFVAVPELTLRIGDPPVPPILLARTATGDPIAIPNIRWQSDDTAVAHVSPAAAVAEGETTVTVSASCCGEAKVAVLVNGLGELEITSSIADHLHERRRGSFHAYGWEGLLAGAVRGAR